MKGHIQNFYSTRSSFDSDIDLVESDDDAQKILSQFDVLLSKTGLSTDHKEIKDAVKVVRIGYEELFKDKIALVQLLARWKHEEKLKLKTITAELSNELESFRSSAEISLSNAQTQLQQKTEKYRSTKLRLLEVEKTLEFTKDENKSLKNQLNKLQRRISTLEGASQGGDLVDKQHADIAARMQSKEQSYVETIRNLEEEIENLRMKHANEEKIHSSLLSQNIVETNQAYRNLQKSFDKLTDDYKKMDLLQTDLRRENQLTKHHSNLLQSQLSEAKEDAKQLKFKHEQEFREMQNQFERKLITSQESFLNDLTHFRDRIAELTRTHEEEMRNLKTENQDKTEKIQSEFELARKNFEEQIVLLRGLHDKVLRDSAAEGEMQKLSSVSGFSSDSRFEQKATEFMAEMQLRFNNIRTELKTPHLSQIFSYRPSPLF